MNNIWKFLCISLLLSLAQPSLAQYTDFPTVEAIFGKTPPAAHVRKSAVLSLFIEKLSMDTPFRELTPFERQRLSEYIAANDAIKAEYSDSFGATMFNTMYMQERERVEQDYFLIKELSPQLADKMFSNQDIVRAYLGATTEEQIKTAAIIGGIIVFLALAIWLLTIPGRNKLREHKRAIRDLPLLATKTYLDLLGEDDLKHLTTQDQIYLINKVFDKKNKELVVFYTKRILPMTSIWKILDYNQQYRQGGQIKFTISKHLGLMEPLERESLRIVASYYCLGKLDDQTFLNLIMTITWGKGDAHISEIMTRPNEGLPFDLLSPPENLERDRRQFISYFIQKILQTTNESECNWVMNGLEQAYLESMMDSQTSGLERDITTKLYKRFHGGNNWLAKADIENSIFKPAGTKYELSLGWHTEKNDYLRFSGDESLITIAPPGAGKTQCQVIPNLLTWTGPAIVLDVKGELYDQTAAWRAQTFGKVIKFDVTDPNTAAFNPFAHLPTDKDELWSEAWFLANMMILQTDQSQPFWEQSAQKILACVLCAMVVDGGERNMRFIMSTLSRRAKLSQCATTLQQSGHDDLVDLGTEIKEFIGREENGSNTLNSVLQQATVSLNGIRGDKIANCTKQSDWTPLDFRKGSKTLYITLQPSKVAEFLPLLRIMVGLHLSELLKQLPGRDTAPILFMLDEFPQLRSMEPILEALAMGRQYKLRLWMITQTMGQLKEAYGDTKADSIISQCAVKSYMNPSGEEADGLAVAISEALGTEESFVDGRQKALVEPFELTGPDYKEKTIVLGTGSKPALLAKKYAYSSEEFSSKLLSNAAGVP